MKVFDLFAGLKGWSEPFEERGHEVWSIELDKRFPGISHYGDIRSLKPEDIPFKPDIILASPPCTTFTTMTMGMYWNPDNTPKEGIDQYGQVVPKSVTRKAKTSLELVKRTISLIRYYKPRFFIVENPRARLRTLGTDLDTFERRTVTYCHYGKDYMKMTDLWGSFPKSLQLKPLCHNQRAGHPDNCCCRDHVAAPRGSYTGVQGNNPAQSAKIPYQLAWAVCLSAERDL